MILPGPGTFNASVLYKSIIYDILMKVILTFLAVPNE